MAEQIPGPRGRPRSSSRSMLEDAAFELFLENGYAGTTVEQITQRAGVSRNTFFNYFIAKSDVFWVHVDERLSTLTEALHIASEEVPLMTSIGDGIARLGSEFGPSQVPWVLTQYELIGSVVELQASALMRVTRVARILTNFAAKRLDVAPSDPLVQALGFAITGAMIAGVQAWAAAGTSRGHLEPYLAAAVEPVCDGFHRILETPADSAL